MEIKIYVVNLKAKEGKWFTLPMDQDQLEKEMAELVGDDEFAIHAYEAPFHVDEYDSPEEMNKHLGRFNKVGSHLTHEQIEALLDCGCDLKPAAELLEQDRVRFHDLGKPYPNWEDLAEYLVLYHDYMNVPEHLKGYIDYGQVGIDLACSHRWSLCNNGIAIEYLE